MAVYTKNAGPTLMGLMAKAAEIAANGSPLEEEVALCRATLARAVEYWNVSLEAKGGSEGTRMQCEAIVREAAEMVSKLVSAAAKVKLLDQGAIQLSSVSWVVGEVTRAIEEVVRETQPELADALVKRLEQVKLPVDGTLEKFTRRASDEAFL